MPRLKRNGTVALETLGCKLNQAESESLARQFAEAGYRIVNPADGADLFVLSTCTVTQIADRKSRHLLRSTRRRNPSALIVATGCYAERAPEELARIEGIDLVLGNEEKARLPQILADRGPIRPATDPSPALRSRSLVKIQEGCNQFCSYCIVPLVRGRERSLPLGQIVDEVKAREAMGYREVVLTGTQIGGYRPGLNALLRHILAETDGVRLRLSSLQPQDLTPELVALWADSRLCRHLHVPLQSGSDPVLGRMRRPYSVADYETAVARVREAIPGIAITTDIMVGFPEESDEEFNESYRSCRRMGFARMHVFPYSERPGTIAAGMSPKVAERVTRERSERMLALAREAAWRYEEQLLGRTVTVLWEKETKDGIWSGLSDNYVRVLARSGGQLRNRLAKARLIGRRKDSLWGELGQHVARTQGGASPTPSWQQQAESEKESSRYGRDYRLRCLHSSV